MPKGHFKRTKKHKENISKALSGKKKSLSHRKKLSENHHDVSGDKNPKWRGGKRKHLGYYLINKPSHPLARKDGYICEHRLVMEKKLGRYLTRKERVHHINGKKGDNRPENIELFAGTGEHTRHHLKGKKRPRAVCEKISKSRLGIEPWNKGVKYARFK